MLGAQVVIGAPTRSIKTSKTSTPFFAVAADELIASFDCLLHVLEPVPSVQVDFRCPDSAQLMDKRLFSFDN